MTDAIERLNQLHEELVPASGHAETMAGEIVRAVARIGYRWFNDGDMLGKGYGRETCNPAARFLMAINPEAFDTIILYLWNSIMDDEYSDGIDALAERAVDLIEIHPELRTQPGVDFWSYKTDEDVDDDEEEDDWY